MASFEIKNDESQDLQNIVSWFQENGGVLSKVEPRQFEGSGTGLITTDDVETNETIVQVPFKLCMSVESAKASDLGPVLEENQWLLDMPDEVLALHLMVERKKGAESFWGPYIQILPREYDTPIFWAEREREALAGTNVLLLTNMMNQQIDKDWGELHQPLVESSPVLSGLTIEDYRWALSTVWSRAFGLTRPVAAQEEGAGEGGSPPAEEYFRALGPIACFVNHDPQAAATLDESLSFEASTCTEEDASSGIAGGGTLRLKCPKSLPTGDQCFILYGPYPNAKLLYSYGFVVPDNPHQGLDFWLKLPQTDTYHQYKQNLLQENPLTQQQTYDFQGTIFGKKGISLALMATVRIMQLQTEQELRDAKKAFAEMVSQRNELASYACLVGALRAKLGRGPTSLEEDEEDLAQAAAFLEDHTSAAAESNLEGEDQEVQNTTLCFLRRKWLGLMVRVDEKRLIKDTIATLEDWFEQVQQGKEGFLKPNVNKI
mmetsp:Transcript_12678/g.18676  ORF Transcript_12678/g.18676 Transcript_12678/m.18676 type:complete len:488 (-) Transcript_12678:167-1630(-)